MSAQALVQELTTARDAYYNGTPVMSDAEFDAKEDQLRKLDPSNTFFSNVGAAATSGWQKVPHRIPMGSLNKAQTETDMRAWHGTIGSPSKGTAFETLIAEKLDGISISIRYDNGTLTQAITRGDGIMGEDITRNVKVMKVPTKLASKWTGFVRGEIVCKKSDFAAHFPGESNPRNTAAGTAKRQSDASKCKHLTVIAFDCIPDDGMTYLTSTPRGRSSRMSFKVQELGELAGMGFEVPHWQVVGFDATPIEAHYQQYINPTGLQTQVAGNLTPSRATVDYEIDGLVLIVNDTDEWHRMGEKNHRPAGSIAYKFPHEAKETTLRNIRWQVGNTGRITPVAEFDVVDLAGAKVKQASLHNISNIERLSHIWAGGRGVLRKVSTSLGPGDTILVSRRNDVIPYVEALVTPGSNATSFLIPTACPECGCGAARSGEYLVCPNTAGCAAQTAGAVKRWVKKVGVLGWGDTTINGLCGQGVINDPADLYTLGFADVSLMEIDGRRIGGNAQIFLTDLHAKKDLPLHVFVGSLGIDLMGRSMVKKLVDAGLDNINALFHATEQTLARIPGMGDTKAKAFHAGIRDKAPLIEKLLKSGVTIQKRATGVLSGLSVCMTGFRDPSMNTAIESQGGSVKSSVSKALGILVCKDPNSTSGKAKKARAQGTTVMGIDAMWEMLGGQP